MVEYTSDRPNYKLELGDVKLIRIIPSRHEHENDRSQTRG